MNWKAPTIVIGILLVIVCGVVLCFWASETAISPDNYERIQIGMTKRQVERILGPPRLEVKPKNPRWLDPMDMGHTQSLPHQWWGAGGVIRIWYLDGRVSHKEFTNHPCEVRPLTLVERLPFKFLTDRQGSVRNRWNST